jgi:hypothetical protein
MSSATFSFAQFLLAAKPKLQQSHSALGGLKRTRFPNSVTAMSREFGRVFGLSGTTPHRFVLNSDPKTSLRAINRITGLAKSLLLFHDWISLTWAAILQSMKFVAVLSIGLLISSLSFSETIRGGNNTFSTYWANGKSGKLEPFVKITRRNDVPEIISLSKEFQYGQVASDVAALNAYLNSGRALQMPTRFKSALDFMYFTANNVRRIDSSISDTLALTYIRNLRGVASDLGATVLKLNSSNPPAPTHPRQMAPTKPQLNYSPKGSN